MIWCIKFILGLVKILSLLFLITKITFWAFIFLSLYFPSRFCYLCKQKHTYSTGNDVSKILLWQNFDALATNTTIIANRTNYIDFTLPYIEFGVTMVVPIKDNERKNAWVFLKPLTWDLWITIGIFFVFIGFVAWVLEHRINEEFRGPPSHEIGTSLWFSFSTMVFAQSKFLSSFSHLL